MLKGLQFRHATAAGLCSVSLEGRSRPKLETRAAGGKFVRGLASVYYVPEDEGTEYWLWSDMVERVMPGAFDRAIAEKHDARCLFNHEPSQLLGRVSAESVRLSVDAAGLWYEADEDPADPDWQRVSAKIDRGDVTGSSFAFVPRVTRWTEYKDENGNYIDVRELVDVDLYDVGPVTYPAYGAATAGRSVGAAAASVPDYVRELRAERDSYRAEGEAVSIRAALLRVAV